MRDLIHVYRPRRLDEVIGQPEVVATVNAYLERGSNQTLLFSGPSGTGKTTLARIIAAQRVWLASGVDPTIQMLGVRGETSEGRIRSLRRLTL
jgi:DNA polymerase III gamma/tau subunit